MLANLFHESAGFQVEAFGGFVRLNERRNLCLADGGGAVHFGFGRFTVTVTGITR